MFRRSPFAALACLAPAVADHPVELPHIIGMRPWSVVVHELEPAEVGHDDVATALPRPVGLVGRARLVMPTARMRPLRTCGMALSMLPRSTTSGSHAAADIVVVPSAKIAADITLQVPVTVLPNDPPR